MSNHQVTGVILGTKADGGSEGEETQIKKQRHVAEILGLTFILLLSV